ncbi:MAG: hypothetical protein M3Q69_16850 [Acidobacteriota bacterium]|nr:hypothetical protein [Acidobacteriota bacterium]
MQERTARTLGAGCLIAFGLPFAAAGIFAGVMLVRDLQQHQADIKRLVLLGCFAVAFTAAGLAVIGIGISGSRSSAAAAMLQSQHPREPWRWNPQWASGRIADSNTTGTFALWFFALLWNAISSPVVILVPPEIRNGNRLALLAFLFPLVGLGLLISAARGSMRAMRFRRSMLILDAMPAPVGGLLRGRVEVPYARIAESPSIIVRLTSIRRTRGSDSTDESVEWQEEHELSASSVQRTMNGVAILIAFAIPDDALPSETSSDAYGVVWRLTVDAELPGLDYAGLFNVPVFRTDVAADRVHAVPVTAPAPRPPAQCEVRQSAAGRELHFEALLAPKLGWSAALFSALWCGIVIVLFAIDDVPGCVTAIFALIAIPLAYYSLDILFGRSTVILGRDQIIVRRTLLGRTSEQVLPRNQLRAVTLKIGAQVTGGRAQAFYDVELHTDMGRKIPAVKYMASKREAEWVAAQIRER